MQFEGAYGLISDLQKMKLAPTASMYNAILAGYFREVLNFLIALFQIFLAFSKIGTISHI